jgi:drug/metabolite transporter (DMT)-like permease
MTMMVPYQGMCQRQEASFHLQGLLYMSVTAYLFGFGTLLLKWIADPLDPVLVTFLALLIGGLLTASVLLVRRQSFIPTFSNAAWLHLLLLSSFGTVLSLLVVILGLGRTSAITRGLLLQLQGPEDAILACLVLGEKLGWMQEAGIALLMLGDVPVAFQGPQMSGLPTSMGGKLCILAGPLGLGYSFIPAKRLSAQTVLCSAAYYVCFWVPVSSVLCSFSTHHSATMPFHGLSFGCACFIGA